MTLAREQPGRATSWAPQSPGASWASLLLRASERGLLDSLDLLGLPAGQKRGLNCSSLLKNVTHNGLWSVFSKNKLTRGQIHNAGLATGRPGGTVGDHQVSVGNPRLSLIFSPITSPAPSLMDIEAGNQTFTGPPHR